jgi:WD40 repeat protein
LRDSGLPPSDLTQGAAIGGPRFWLGWLWSYCRNLFQRIMYGESLKIGEFAVFISYRHVEPDRRVAEWLHGAIETFVIPRALRRPEVGKRLGRVFRDEEELAATDNLPQEIEQALNRSRWLVVVCSPRAVQSPWVSREIGHFRQLGRDKQILALLIEGEPTSSFPTCLYDVRGELQQQDIVHHDEPLAADMRASDEPKRRVRKLAKLRLLATILGCRFDELRQREQERHQRRILLLTGLVFLVLVIVGYLGVQARQERDQALLQGSRALAIFAQQASDAGDQLTAMLVALEALPDPGFGGTRPLSSAAAAALQQAWLRNRETALAGHSGYILSASFSPDGTHVVTASADGTARVWDLRGERPSFVAFKGHKALVKSALFSPDGTHVVTASADGTARVSDLRGARPNFVALEGHKALVESASFSRDGTHVFTTSSDGTARVWDLRGERPSFVAVERWKGPPNLPSFCSFSPDGTHVLTAAADGTARVWDLRGEPPSFVALGKAGVWDMSGEHGPRWVALGGEAPINWASFSPDGRHAVSTSTDGTARVWDLQGDRPTFVALEVKASVQSASFSPNGTHVVTTSNDQTSRVWDLRGERPSFVVLEGHQRYIYSASFSPDGMHVVTASDDRTARVWDLRSKRPSFVALEGHKASVKSALFSPDGTHVVTGSADGTARVWDLRGARPSFVVLEGHKASVYSASFSPDGSHVVTTLSDGTARLWDLRGELRSSLVARALGAWVASSSDGAHVLTVSADGTARMWDLRGARPELRRPRETRRFGRLGIIRPRRDRCAHRVDRR